MVLGVIAVVVRRLSPKLLVVGLLIFQVAVGLPLQHPSQDLIDNYDHTSIVAVRDSSFFFAIAVTIMLIPRVVIWLAHEFCTINVVNLDDLSSAQQPLLNDVFVDSL